MSLKTKILIHNVIVEITGFFAENPHLCLCTYEVLTVNIPTLLGDSLTASDLNENQAYT